MSSRMIVNYEKCPGNCSALHRHLRQLGAEKLIDPLSFMRQLPRSFSRSFYIILFPLENHVSWSGHEMPVAVLQ